MLFLTGSFAYGAQPNGEAMAPPEGTSCDFVAWLCEQDVDNETASMVINDLGINSFELLRSSTETPQLRAEFFALIKGRLPFARYAMMRRVVEVHGVSLNEPLLSTPMAELSDDQSRQQALNAVIPEVLINYLERASKEMHNCSRLLKEYHGIVDQSSAPNVSGMTNGTAKPLIRSKYPRVMLKRLRIPKAECFEEDHAPKRYEVNAAPTAQEEIKNGD